MLPHVIPTGATQAKKKYAVLSDTFDKNTLNLEFGT